MNIRMAVYVNHSKKEIIVNSIMDIEELKDKIALKELVDRVSTLADKKDFAAQVQLFTEDAVSETIANEVVILQLKGRKRNGGCF